MSNHLNQNETAEVVVEAISKSEEFFKSYGKTLLYGTIVVVAVVAGYLAYHNFVYKPKAAEAKEQTFPAEAKFREASYDLALNGDGNILGFSQIIDEYGSKAGKVVYFYAGVCELQLGNFEAAINYLKSYKGKDSILKARSLACIGDAYVGLTEYENALSYFEKAAKTADNNFAATYLLKAAAVCEELGKTEEAKSFYQTIKDSYPQSIEAYDIDKYISKIDAK